MAGVFATTTPTVRVCLDVIAARATRGGALLHTPSTGNPEAELHAMFEERDHCSAVEQRAKRPTLPSTHSASTSSCVHRLCCAPLPVAGAGLMGCTMAARQLGLTPPCVMQNDYSLINRVDWPALATFVAPVVGYSCACVHASSAVCRARHVLTWRVALVGSQRIEENSLSEASAPWNEDVGFMAYNVLAGGMLTGKYLDVPAAADDPNRARALASSMRPRGRMDENGWGQTLVMARGRITTPTCRVPSSVS